MAQIYKIPKPNSVVISKSLRTQIQQAGGITVQRWLPCHSQRGKTSNSEKSQKQQGHWNTNTSSISCKLEVLMKLCCSWLWQCWCPRCYNFSRFDHHMRKHVLLPQTHCNPDNCCNSVYTLVLYLHVSVYVWLSCSFFIYLNALASASLSQILRGISEGCYTTTCWWTVPGLLAQLPKKHMYPGHTRLY